MNKKTKKFSILSYQEELIKKLNSKNENKTSWIYILDKKNKIWKINSLEIEYVEEVKFLTLLPPFNNEVLAVANIQEKESLIIDIDAYLYKEESIFRLKKIPKKYKFLLFKDKKTGILTNIVNSYVDEKNNIEEINITELKEKILTYSRK